TLPAGNYVVGSAGNWLTNGDNYYFGGSYTTATGLTFVQDRFNLGGSLAYPLSTVNATPAWFGGNVSVLVTDVPDVSDVPGPLPLLGAAAAFGYSRKLRARLKKGKIPSTFPVT
ncbi:MAG: hypothetical protein ACKO58_06260, partial [Cyanobium sp.]